MGAAPDGVEALLLDLSGVVYVEDEAVPGAAEVLSALRERGVPLRLVTNTTMRPRRSILERLERQFAGAVGAATAHAVLAQVAGRAFVSVEDLMAVADETVHIMESSARLEAKSEELARTARALREANDKLTTLSIAPLIARAIREVFEDGSVTSMFDGHA